MQLAEALAESTCGVLFALVFETLVSYAFAALFGLTALNITTVDRAAADSNTCVAIVLNVLVFWFFESA